MVLATVVALASLAAPVVVPPIRALYGVPTHQYYLDKDHPVRHARRANPQTLHAYEDRAEAPQLDNYDLIVKYKKDEPYRCAPRAPRRARSYMPPQNADVPAYSGSRSDWRRTHGY